MQLPELPAPARQHPPIRTYAYGPFALLQRACTYVYDAAVLPSIANTYATATTLTVITGTYQRATTTTTTTAHRNCHSSKSGRKRAVDTPCSLQSTSFGASVPTYVYDYNGTIQQRNEPAAPTPTTTDNTTAIYTEIPANYPPRPASGTPTAYSDVHDYGYRHLSTELGRWLSRDPMEEFADINLFGFVHNRSTDSSVMFDSLQKPRSSTRCSGFAPRKSSDLTVVLSVATSEMLPCMRR